jgi:hypothetical protein
MIDLGEFMRNYTNNLKILHELQEMEEIEELEETNEPE